MPPSWRSGGVDEVVVDDAVIDEVVVDDAVVGAVVADDVVVDVVLVGVAAAGPAAPSDAGSSHTPGAMNENVAVRDRFASAGPSRLRSWSSFAQSPRSTSEWK